MGRFENSTHEWILETICQDYTFWLVTSGCVVFGFLLGLVITGLLCRKYHRKSHRSSPNGAQGPSKGTYYFDERHNLSRKPTDHNVTSNFYTNDVTEMPTSSVNFYENQRHGIPADKEIDESDDENVDDYIKMTKPPKNLPRSNSRKQKVQKKIDEAAMYISMS
ncbi:uncharacterized protein LOC125654807 [Ostrea edulis]|uniref:uncharacterized protein LOC125654807 n=1 Tax=Ostrea edulis TaxID=37623 RepID=UPI0020952EE2|nr:uncharacterized protein LOC125654807 [Ostrea edulis]XP_048740851.1 uncharacterized protein LOC125654807 [Ostrea edulis]